MRHEAPDDFCADPLANAVYWWVAESGSAVHGGRCHALITAYSDHVSAAPTLYRGEPGLASAGLTPGATWTIDAGIGPWAAFTTRFRYAAMWADSCEDGPRGCVLILEGGHGLDLLALRNRHAGFIGTEDAYYEGNLYDRLASEHEWLVGPARFTVTAVDSQHPVPTVTLRAARHLGHTSSFTPNRTASSLVAGR